MAVSEQTAYAASTGNGVATVFPFAFKVLAAADLAVYVAGALKTLNVDYTVSGVGVDAGGSVTFTAAPANGAAVIIARDMPRTRTTDYQNQGDFLATTVNADFDRAILLLQDLAALLGRSIAAPIYEPNALMTLPPKAARAGLFLGFDANGDVEPVASIGATALSRSVISNLLDPQTSAESAVPVTPAATYYEEGDLYRYGAAGDGATDDLVPLTRANSVSIQVKGPTTRVHRGTFRVSDNITITEDLDFSRGGGLISVDSGKVVTIAGRVMGPARQFFTGAGSVVFAPGRNEFVHPEWWGAIPDDSTDCFAAIAKAIAALPTGGGVYGGVVQFLKGIYRSGDKILQPNGVELRGVSCNTSAIKATNTFNKTALIANSAQDGTQEFARIADLLIDGNKGGGAVCSVAVVDWVSLFVNSYIRDCLIQNGSAENLHLGANFGAGPVLIENTWLLSPNGHNVLIDENVANTAAVAGICLRNCTVEHQAAGKAGVRIKGYGRIFGVNILDLHVEQANSGAGTYALQLDGASDVKVDGIQVQSASGSSGGIRIENNALNTRYSFRNVTNINVVNPIIDDQLEGVQHGGVHVPWDCSSDIGVYRDRTQTLTYGASVATNVALGSYCILVITNGTAFTIANPTNARAGQRVTYEIVNASGGAHGTISWGANFAYRDSSLGAIANGKRRTITFEYRGSNVWAQVGAATGDM